MIEQRAQALVSLIARQSEIQKHLHLLDGFRTQASEVNTVRRRIDRLVDIWKLLRDRGVLVPDLLGEAERMQEEVQQLRDKFTEDPAYILGANRLASLKVGMRALCDRLERDLASSWETHALQRAPNVNVEVLMVLATIGPLRTQVDRVSRGLRELNERIKTLPSSAKEIDDFDKSAANVNAAWGQLDSDHLRPDVLQFLKAAGVSTGAKLDLLTGPVTQWLQSHELSDAFRIRSIAGEGR
jgi:hypothetical protein